MILRGLLLSLIFGLCRIGAADPVLSADEIVERFAGLSSLERADTSYQFCEQSLAAWPSLEYQSGITRLGQLWKEHPEAAYQTLSLCQSMWEKSYFDPARVARIRQYQGRERLALYVSMADIVGVYHYLREQIALFNTTVPSTSQASTPPAPYEILSDMAASTTQLDAVLLTEIRESSRAFAESLAGYGGGAAALFKGAKAVAEITGLAGRTVGVAVKQALLITAVAMGAGMAADYLIWRNQESDLLARVHQVLDRLNLISPNDPTLSIYLAELTKAFEQLGYFYNIQLYLSEGTKPGEGAALTPTHVINPKCLALAKHALGTGESADVVEPFLTGSLCPDASLVWLAASQYLAQRFPQHTEARIAAAKLLNRARRVLLSESDLEAYWAGQPKCREVVHPEVLFKRSFRCGDDSKDET